MARKRLGEILIEAGIITPEKLQLALKEQQRWGGQLGEIFVKKGMVSEKVLVQALSKQLKFPIVDVSKLTLNTELKNLVPESFASQHCLIPFRKDGKFLDIAMSRPVNIAIMDELRIRTQMNIRPHLAGPSEITKAIQVNYGYGGSMHESRYFQNNEIDFELDTPIPRARTNNDTELREAEIVALQKRLLKLEGLVARDENVIRRLMGLLIKKGVATREEILEAINH